jgi:tripartite-type tricarboxylate transporter receptor subunit TctC
VRYGLGLAVFFACFAVGCGGGGGDRLSQEEFQQQANAICEKYDKKIQALGSPQSPADIPAFVEKGIPLLRQGIAELRALKPPADVEDDYNRMLDETAKAIPAAEKLADAAEKSDAAAVQEAIQEGQQADDASDQLAAKLNLDGCAAE